MPTTFWFPMYCNDFLASTKIAVMTTEEIGAYTLLLCHAWQDPQCSLPADEETLKKLGRISGDISNIRACFIVKRGRLVNERLLKEWVKANHNKEMASQSAKQRWDKKRTTDAMRSHIRTPCSSPSPSPSPKEEDRIASTVQKPSSTLTDELWIQSFKTNPLYTGIDIDLQLKRAQSWLQTNAPRRQFTRKYFGNWMTGEIGKKPMIAESLGRPCQTRVKRGLEFTPCNKPATTMIGTRPVCAEHDVKKDAL